MSWKMLNKPSGYIQCVIQCFFLYIQNAIGYFFSFFLFFFLGRLLVWSFYKLIACLVEQKLLHFIKDTIMDITEFMLFLKWYFYSSVFYFCIWHHSIYIEVRYRLKCGLVNHNIQSVNRPFHNSPLFPQVL